MSRAWALGAMVALYSPGALADVATTDVPSSTLAAKPQQKPNWFSFRLAPEWSFRRFSDSEPSSTDKHYAATGILGLNAHVDVYPFAGRPDALGNVGLFASYGQAVGLKSIDIDTSPPSDVSTNWYSFDLGPEYRFPSSTSLSFILSAAYERCVFDFDEATPSPLGSGAFRESPTARYSLARVGSGVTLALESVRFLGQLQAMYPFSIAPLGDRAPTTGGFGARGKLGVAVDLTPMFAIDFDGAYSLFTFHLPSVPGRSDAPGSVLDQYFVTSLGLTLRL